MLVVTQLGNSTVVMIDVIVVLASGILKAIASLGVAGFIGIIVGGLVVLILLLVCIICTCRR